MSCKGVIKRAQNVAYSVIRRDRQIPCIRREGSSTFMCFRWEGTSNIMYKGNWGPFKCHMR